MGYGAEVEAQMLFKLREDLIKKMIDQRLTDQEVQRLKLKISDKEIDNAMERIKADNGFTEETFREVLAREGLTLETYRDRVRDQILRGKLVNYEVKSKIVITRDDVREYYEKNRGALSGDRKINLSVILLKVPPGASQTQRDAVRSRLEAIHGRLKAGEDFSTLAREFSEGPGAQEGGALGSFKLGALSPEVKQAVAGLKAGEFSPVVDTDAGVQIFRVVETEQAADPPLESVYSDIEEKLFREIVDRKFDAWLEGLRSRSYIKIIR
jgi:peptidyl-prolyl cis-trans isomerase SurA